MAGLDPSKPFVPLAIAVLTVSDTRDQASDKSGALLQERIEAAGHKLAARALVKDEVKAIRAQVKAWIKDKKIDVVITTGGTGPATSWKSCRGSASICSGRRRRNNRQDFRSVD